MECWSACSCCALYITSLLILSQDSLPVPRVPKQQEVVRFIATCTGCGKLQDEDLCVD